MIIKLHDYHIAEKVKCSFNCGYLVRGKDVMMALTCMQILLSILARKLTENKVKLLSFS